MTSPTQSPGMSELRGLLEKATKGPWITHRLFPDSIVPESHALRPVGGAEGEAVDRDDYALVIAWPRDDRHGRSNGRANAALIVAAVNSLPTLLDDLAAAQGEIDRLRADNSDLLAGADADAFLLSAAQARADRMEGALRGLVAAFDASLKDSGAMARAIPLARSALTLKSEKEGAK